MKLTSKKALELLNEARGKTNNDDWIKHSICVGDTAALIAEKLNIDSEMARTLGYIHDIGKKVGPFEKHITNGYMYLKDLGYDDEYCEICLVHSFLNNDIYCTAGGVLCDEKKLENFIKNHKYTIYDKLINLCDLMCTNEVCGLEKRLEDIISRYGKFENTEYHVKAAEDLKKYFDSLLGYNLYELILEKK